MVEPAPVPSSPLADRAVVYSFMLSSVSFAGRCGLSSFAAQFWSLGYGRAQNVREFTRSHTLMSSVAQLAALTNQVA